MLLLGKLWYAGFYDWLLKRLSVRRYLGCVSHFLVLTVDVATNMRKLRGGTTKETKKDKLEKRKDKETINDQVYKLVLPTLGAITALIIIVVYLMTRPAQITAA